MMMKKKQEERIFCESKMGIKIEKSKDRLGALPDYLIHHILSFIDTKYAVQTCVLSKTWMHHWTCLSSLNLDSKSFKKSASFTNFIDRLLSVLDWRPSPNLNLYNLNILSEGKDLVESLVMKRAICYAACRNVQHLNLVFHSTHLQLPPCIFSCATLTTFTLKTLCRIQMPNSLGGLVSVTKLHLENVSFSDNQSNDYNCRINPFSCCLKLENLALLNCSSPFFRTFHISAPQLANLTISRGDGFLSFVCKVVVSTPKLVSFDFRDYCALNLSADNNLPSLKKLNVDMDSWYLQRLTNEGKKTHISDLINMLSQFYNAEDVTLSLSTVEVLSMVPDLLTHQSSSFKNMKSLKLKAKKSSTTLSIPAHVMTYLLINSSPCVETVLVEL